MEYDEEEVCPSPAKKARFGSVSESELDLLDQKKIRASTRESTKKWLNVLHEYVKEKDVDIDLASVEADELGNFLRRLYVDIRQRDGSYYSKASLLSFRAGIHRHLTEDLGRDIDIYKDAAFRQANNTLDARLKNLKRSGFCQPAKHKPALSDSDLTKLITYFNEEGTDPIRLTKKVWFYVAYHFCLRGREIQALMHTSDLEIKKDENQKEFVSLSTSFATKNYQVGLRRRLDRSDTTYEAGGGHQAGHAKVAAIQRSPF